MILFGIVGLSAVVGYLDYVLFPALAFFVGLAIYACGAGSTAISLRNARGA